MSKGPGKWERAILQALEQPAAFYLIDLLPVPHTRSQTVALNRAARKLEDTGKIEIARWMFAGGDGYLTIFRPGDPSPRRDQIARLKSCTRPARGTDATFNKPTKTRSCENGPIIETDYTVVAAD
jgi:hypothetical protein